MFMNTHESQNTMTNNESKSRSKIYPLVPISLKLLQKFVKNSQSPKILQSTRLVVVARLLKIKQMVGRFLLNITDETGIINIIQPKTKESDQLQQDCYYRFTLTCKKDKDELIFYNQSFERVVDFNQIQYHQLTVMIASQKGNQILNL